MTQNDDRSDENAKRLIWESNFPVPSGFPQAMNDPAETGGNIGK
jgi:hypothetical protein